MDSAVARRFVPLCGLATAALFALGGCNSTPPLAATRDQIIISVRDQKLTLIKEDHSRVSFPISTSKFGLGDRRGTYATPTGELAVAAKIGDGAAPGSVFHGRVRTGEVVKIDAPGRDAIVTRILALKGLESGNAQAFSRGIYIHGTPEERNIGRPTSYGCIRMRSSDVIALYGMVKVGAKVQIIDSTQNQAIAANILHEPAAVPAGPAPATIPVPPTTKAPATGPVPPGTPGTAAPAAPGGAASAAVATTTTKTTATAAGAATVATTVKPNGTTVTTIAKATPAPAVAAAPTPAGPARKVWVGSPNKLLAKEDAKAKTKPPVPVGAPPTARPISNDTSGSKASGPNTAQHSMLE